MAITNNQSKSGFTRVENYFLDSVMSFIDGSEWKVLCSIIRLLVGYQKESDIITTTEIEKKSGLTENTILNCLKKLVSYNLIKLSKVKKKGFIYNFIFLNFDYLSYKLPEKKEKLINKVCNFSKNKDLEFIELDTKKTISPPQDLRQLKDQNDSFTSSRFEVVPPQDLRQLTSSSFEDLLNKSINKNIIIEREALDNTINTQNKSTNDKKNDDDDFKKLELINEENNKMMDSEFKDFNNLLLRHNSVNEPKKEFSKYNFPITQPSDLNKSNLSNEKSSNDKIYVTENLTQNLTKQQRENTIYLESIGIKKDKTNYWLEIINLPFRLIEDEYIKILDMVDRGQSISNIASYTLKCLEKIAINQKSIDQEQLRVRGKDTSYYWAIFNIHSEMREKYPSYFREIQRYLAQSQSEIDLASDLFKKAEKILNNHSDSKELKVILQDFCNKVDNKNLFGAWLSGCIGCRGFNEEQMYYILELVR